MIGANLSPHLAKSIAFILLLFASSLFAANCRAADEGKTLEIARADETAAAGISRD